jgi:hypothetical protein
MQMRYYATRLLSGTNDGTSSCLHGSSDTTLHARARDKVPRQINPAPQRPVSAEAF